MKKIFSIVLCCVFLFCLSACEKFDENYGKSSARPEISENKAPNVEIKIPEIKSDDDVMPTYVDISLYDEENYADKYEIGFSRSHHININHPKTINTIAYMCETNFGSFSITFAKKAFSIISNTAK